MQFLDLPIWSSLLRGLMAFLCQVIYPIIGFMYELFSNVSKINILSGAVEPIYQRVTLILTIVMVFYITFQFVKYVVQPDALTDKEKGAGNIIYKAIIVVILIAFVPTIFETAYKVQSKIIDNNVISKVILGTQAATEDNLGSAFSSTIFGMFYYVDEENAKKNCHDGADCQTIVDNNLYNLSSENSLSSLDIGLNATEKRGETPLITFDGLLAVLFGGVILYILLLYCIDVGVRWVQLIYLQVIAPIPIIGYLSPKKDGIFQKWTKQCFTTYLDLFLRVAIINIVLLLCDTILKAKNNLDQTGGLLAGLGEVSGMMETLIYMVLIMGVMLFAHKAPKMLAELFPKTGAAGGNFGLKAKDRGLQGASRVFGAAAGVTVGAGVGLATGLGQGLRRMNKLDSNAKWYQKAGAGLFGATKGAIGGTIGGAGRGLVNGSKKGNIIKNVSAGAKNQIKANQRFGNREESGYSFGNQVGDMARSAVGARSRVEMLENDKAPISRHNDALKKVADTRSQIEKRALDKMNEGGKGGAASRKYAQKANELKALQEDQNVRDKKFKVARFTDDRRAQEAYEADIALARAAVNKSNFINPHTGEFDQIGYEKACQAATARIKASDYSVAYASDEQAQEAYENAVKAKVSTIDRANYKTEEEYNIAVEKAKNSVNAEIYTKGYATQKEAEDALGAEILKLRQEVDKAKDEAVAEYISTVQDGAIDSMLATLAAEVKEYNKSASASKQIGKSEENVFLTEENELDIAKIKESFDKFNDYVKKDKGGIQNNMDTNATTLVGINSEIERIKRQTSGSGINEGKK